MQQYYRDNEDYHRTISAREAVRPNDEERALFGQIVARRASDRRAVQVLELGCGGAESALGLLRALPSCRYFGMDASPSAVSVAQKRLPDHAFAVGDISSLPFDDEQFDVCYMNYVLEHAVFPDQVLKEAARVLRPRGLLGMIVPVTDLPWMLPASLRHRERDIVFRAHSAVTSVLHAAAVRYIPGFHRFRLVDEPVALRHSSHSEWRPDDDLVYWATSMELAKYLTAIGMNVVWTAGRDISSYVQNGRRVTVDLARSVFFSAYRALLCRPRGSVYTTTVSLLGEKQSPHCRSGADNSCLLGSHARRV